MQKLFLLLIFVGAVLCNIGFPSGSCPDGYHYCGDKCPFALEGCLLADQCSRNGSSSDYCFGLLNQYCQTSGDPACAVYGCDAQRPYRCPSALVCVASAAECPLVDPRVCAPRNQVCGQFSQCPGKYFCGENGQGVSCRNDMWERCNNTGGYCGQNYDRGSGVCSNDPTEYRIPFECTNNQGQPLPNYCSLDTCQPGEHYCGRARCVYADISVCTAIDDCYRALPFNATNEERNACQNISINHCINSPNDPGCCPGQIPCGDGRCAASQNECRILPKNSNCAKIGQPCAVHQACFGKYFCGSSVFGESICRNNLEDLCPNTTYCWSTTKGDRPYTCGHESCSGDPRDCVFGIENGECDQGEHLCFESCPFASGRACLELGKICGDINGTLSQECQNAANNFCTNIIPNDPGCCERFGKQRCLTSGQCVDNLNQCPSILTSPKCAAANETCQFACPGKYYCGPGATCSDSLNQKCRDGPCIGGFYCGNNYGKVICSNNPLSCSPPEPYDYDDKVCLWDGEIRCNVLFSNETFFESLGQVCGEVGPSTGFSGLPASCKDAINNYCASSNGAADVGCCKNGQIRCEKSFLCADSLAQCGHTQFCTPISVGCPAVNPNDPCGGKGSCGGNWCAESPTTPCPLGSPCAGKFFCDDDNQQVICTDVAGQCNPPVGTPAPNCTNGGVTCSANQDCIDRSFNGVVLSTCVCKQGFVPNLANPTECVADNTPGGLLAGCGPNRGCINPFQCNNGICSCPRGTTWDGTKCVQPTTIPPNIPIGSQCQGSGDIHFTDFAGLFWDYQGTCDIVVARTPNIEVQVRPMDCGGGGSWVVSCVDEVGIIYNGKKIRLTQNGALVDGSSVTIPYNAGLGGSIVPSGYGAFTFNFPNGSVVYQPYYFAANFDASLSSLTTGVCGNWSAAGRNKLFYRNETYDNYLGFSRPLGFTDDWIVDSSKGDPIIFPASSSGSCRESVKKRTLVDTCGNDTFAFITAANLCGPILNQAQNCSSYLDVTDFYNACIFDVCSTGENIFAQRLLNAVKSACEFKKDVVASTITTTAQATTSVVTGDETASASSVSAFVSLLFALIFVLLC